MGKRRQTKAGTREGIPVVAVAAILAALLLGYWFAVDGRQHGAALVKRALAKGARFMFGKIKRMAMEMEREEGRQETEAAAGCGQP